MSNNMRTAKEKEKIVKEYYLIGQAKICHKYNISKSVIWNWVKKYEVNLVVTVKIWAYISENLKIKLKN